MSNRNLARCALIYSSSSSSSFNLPPAGLLFYTFFSKRALLGVLSIYALLYCFVTSSGVTSDGSEAF